MTLDLCGCTQRVGVPAQLRYLQPRERPGYKATLPEDLILNLPDLSALVFIMEA